MPATAPANPELIAARLRQPIWQRIDHVTTTGSTNRDLIERAQAGEPPPAVLISEHQSSGRGRLGRVWEAPPGASLAISILVRPETDSATWSWLPLIAGLAVRTAILSATSADPTRVELKWPNDVLIDSSAPHGGKVAGILVERISSPESAVVGIGLNTDLSTDELPVPTATSLARCGLAVPKDDLLVALLDEFAHLVSTWSQQVSWADAYAAACATLGHQVRVETAGGELVGRATGVDAQGRLVVESGGRTHHLAAGDVTHLR